MTEDGSYDVSGSTELNDPEADVTFEADATIADLGSDLRISGGATLDIQTHQSFSFTSLGISQGTLTGAASDNLTVTGSMTWVGGTISGFGTLSIAGGAALALGGGNFSYVDETLDGVALDNAGAASFSAVRRDGAARTAPGSTTSRAAASPS